MMRLLAVVLGVAWAFAGFRNLPRLPAPQSAAAGALIAGAIALAYVAGKRRQIDSAVAVAVANAEAHAAAVANVAVSNQASSNVQVIIVDPDRGAARAGAATGLGDLPWMVGTHRSVELDETEVIDTMLEDVQSREGETV